MAKSGSSIGSSSEENSPVSLAATENLQGKFEEPDETGQKTIVEAAVDKPRDFTSGSSGVSNYASSSLKQQKKKTITQATRRSTCKSTK
jgi:hypothetical protein